MRRSILIAIPAAAGLGMGAAGFAAADDPPKRPPRPQALHAMPFPMMSPVAGPLPLGVPFGLDRQIAGDMAKELGIPADRVAAAMRKAIAAQFDRRRDEALKCFDDPKACRAPVRPPRPKP